MVKIFSGDDTDFKGDQRLALTFAAPDVDFTGCTAEIEFLGQRRTFAQVTNGGRLVFSFSADETRGMRCGVWPVTIRLRDASGRVRTVDNTQRIKVTNDVNEAYADTEQEISVALRSGGVAMPEIPASLDVDSADSVGQFKAKFNSLLDLLRNVAAIAVAVLLPFAANAASVATAPINNIPGTASVVTNVTFDGLLTEHQDISGKADKTNTYMKTETDASKRGKTDLAVYDGYAPWTIWADGHQMTRNGTGWEIHDDEFGADRILSWAAGVWTLVGNLDSGDREMSVPGDKNALRLVFGSEVLWRTAIYVTNGAHIVTSDELCAIVTNEVHTFGEWVATSWDPEYYGEFLTYGGPWYNGNDSWNLNYRPKKGMAFDRWSFTNGSEYATELVFSGSFGETNFILTLTRTHVSENALGLARLPDITNTVTKAYVESLGIEAGISAATAMNIAEDAAAAATAGLLSQETDPVWDAAKGEYATTGTVAQVSEAVGTLWSYVYGDSVWIAVTNYMRTIGGVSPSFQLWEVRNGATNLVYWSKEEITNVTHDLIYDCKTNLEQTVRNAVAEMPDKAWSKYQSATGNEAPDGVTIVSTPTIQLTGGGEWYRYVDVSSNSVWFLKSNGLHTFGGDTNGYFRILDDEGNATFEVRKTDSYLVDAVASSVHFDENGNFCVSFESNIQPVIYTTASLSAPNFLPEGEDPNVTVTWTQSGGTYTATLEQTVKGPSLFAYAKVEVQGTTVIRNTAPTDVSGGILCTDGIHKCRPVYSNGSITWEVVQ